ncbi:MAG: hypothetical protein NW202_13280 [Nitrospira sp.]|nr:hypothetical protein [Nitrospira sp.]
MTKKKTKRKPRLTLADLSMRVGDTQADLEIAYERIAELEHRTGVLAADTERHIDALKDRMADLEHQHGEGRCMTYTVTAGGTSTATLKTEHMANVAPEPVIPEGWKRTTKEGATRDALGRYWGFWCSKRLGWGKCDWYYDTPAGADAEPGRYIFLARDLPELPESLRDHWESCDESEAWPMGRDMHGDPLFAAWESGYRFPMGWNKPFSNGVVPVKPRVKK